MKAVIILGSATVFFLLQAVYWVFASRSSKVHQRIIERLGTMENADFDQSALLRHHDESWLAQLSIAQRLSTLLEEAGEEPSLAPLIGRMAVAWLIAFAILVTLTQKLFGPFVFSMGAAFIPVVLLQRKRRQRSIAIEEQLPEALEVMSISLRAGHSLAQTINLTAQELQAPIGEEFQRVADEQRLGRPVDQCLLNMSRRLASARTVRTFVVVVLVLRQTGGNLVEVLETIIDTMRQQTQYERKLMAMTAEGRSSARILGGLPPIFVFMMYLGDPSYLGNLLTDSMGQVLGIVAIGLWLAGTLWIRRMVTPKGAR